MNNVTSLLEYSIDCSVRVSPIFGRGCVCMQNNKQQHMYTIACLYFACWAEMIIAFLAFKHSLELMIEYSQMVATRPFIDMICSSLQLFQATKYEIQGTKVLYLRKIMLPWWQKMGHMILTSIRVPILICEYQIFSEC